MKMLILMCLVLYPLAGCLAGESSCRVFVEPKKPYEMPLVKAELLGLSLYPLDYVAGLEKYDTAFRITRSGGWGKTVSYTITQAENGNAIYSKNLIIVEQKHVAILMKSSLLVNEDLNEIKKMISELQLTVTKYSEAAEEPTPKDLEMDTPFILIEQFSAEGYKGSIILPAGYHLLSGETEDLLGKLADLTDKGKEGNGKK